MKDKLILITGGSSGISLNLAKEYSREGCSIILLARNQARLDDTLMQCKDLMDHDTQEFYAFSTDVDDQEQLKNVINTIWRAGYIGIKCRQCAKRHIDESKRRRVQRAAAYKCIGQSPCGQIVHPEYG